MTTSETQPKKDDLETALGAAAEAGQQEDTGDDIAADDAGASKLAMEVQRENMLPTSHPPGKGDD